MPIGADYRLAAFADIANGLRSGNASPTVVGLRVRRGEDLGREETERLFAVMLLTQQNQVIRIVFLHLAVWNEMVDLVDRDSTDDAAEATSLPNSPLDRCSDRRPLVTHAGKLYDANRSDILIASAELRGGSTAPYASIATRHCVGTAPLLSWPLQRPDGTPTLTGLPTPAPTRPDPEPVATHRPNEPAGARESGPGELCATATDESSAPGKERASHATGHDCDDAAALPSWTKQPPLRVGFRASSYGD